MSTRVARPAKNSPEHTNTTWLDHAECRWYDPELFFSQSDEHGRTKTDKARIWDAKKVCARCPVTTECATTYWNDRHAIIAGTTPDERRTIDKQNQQ